MDVMWFPAEKDVTQFIVFILLNTLILLLVFKLYRSYRAALIDGKQ
jgi:hypothetical protein